MLRSWLRQLKNRPSRPANGARDAARRWRPRVQELEDRCVLSETIGSYLIQAAPVSARAIGGSVEY